MRKGIGLALMVFVVIGFYLSIKQMKPVQTTEDKNSQVLAEIDNKINDQYPKDPVEIITMHNTLMNKLYGKELTEEQIEKIVQLQRALYEQGFLELTSKEKQLDEINEELLINKEKKLKIISSKVMSSYEDPEGVMNVEVIHFTNKLDIERHYFLAKETKEDGQEEEWKIFGWKDIKTSDLQEEEE